MIWCAQDNSRKSRSSYHKQINATIKHINHYKLDTFLTLDNFSHKINFSHFSHNINFSSQDNFLLQDELFSQDNVSH